jgi:hydroxypyruvate isomerase
MPVLERLQRVADEGAKAYSFWAFGGKDLDKMRAIQDRHKMTCASITGANKTGWNTGLTKTGYEKEFLADFSEAVAVAKKMGVPNLITFVGEIQKDITPEVQHAQIVSGTEKGGRHRGRGRRVFDAGTPERCRVAAMSVNTTAYAYKIIAEVAHPHVKVDFDLYHRQLGEGNLINTLKTGLEKGYVPSSRSATCRAGSSRARARWTTRASSACCAKRATRDTSAWSTARRLATRKPSRGCDALRE